MQLSYHQTNKFPLNSSTSKQQYLFPKAKRFLTQIQPKQKINFYTIQSTINYDSKKAPSFPKLKRNMEFPNEKSKNIVPSPSTYSLKSDIQQSLQSKKGISIPKSRTRLNKSTLTPGPTAYNPSPQPFPTQRYSMPKSKKKLQFPLELRKGHSSPGPAYLVNLSKLQKVVGKFTHNKCMKVYSQPSLKRVHLQTTINPQQKISILNKSLLTNRQVKSHSLLGLQSNKKPTQNLSPINSSVQKNKKIPSLLLTKNHQSVLGKFGKEQRKTIFQKKSTTPAPTYNWFSEFSQLQKKIYTQKLTDKKANKIAKK